jgi:4-amino-4-deoxy-L-arabinose transferase-like glycosyltransferase
MVSPTLVTEWTGRGEAIVLAMVAGGLFVAEGFYLPYSTVALPFASVSLPAAGAISVAAGLAIVFLAALYRSYGAARSSVGVVIVLIAAGDLWFGGGFWVGTLLGTVAGVLIIVLPPYPRFHQPP